MKNLLLLILMLVAIQASFAQSQKEKADEYFNNQQWSEATTAYSKYLKKNESDSSAYYNLGFSQLQLEDYESAVKNFSKAEQQNFPIGFTSLNKAKALMGLQSHDKAIAALKQGADNGAAAYMRINTDSEFDPIRNDEVFKEALELTKLNAYPCLRSKERRHFDFWLGEWDVYANGQKVGDNSITMANGGCAIHENYTTGNRNYTGQSINYYDPIDKKWHQHWVGSGGDVYNYLETDQAEGMLQFESKFMNARGQISMSRLTFTLNDDGTVRQLFESSTDEGKTWTSAFDGLYKKKE